MNILVTGGTGYIGSHVVVELVNAGHNPIIVDNFNNSRPEVLSSIAQIIGKEPVFYEHDYADSEFLKGLFVKENIEGVIHFAAYKAVGESVDNPLKYYRNNIAGLVTLLETMEVCSVNNLVFSSSCTVYGETDEQPLNEESEVQPANSPYGSTKQMGERIISDATAASRQLRSVFLRYFNPIGAHPSSRIGELPLGKPSNLVPFLTQTVAGWHKELTVFGNDYPTIDGTCIRDYVHVIDLAKAHIKAVEFLSKKDANFIDVFNVGTGDGKSVLEIIRAFEKATKQKVPYIIGPKRSGDVVCAYASTEKINRELDWRAEKTIEDSLLDAWNWQRTLIKPEV